MDKLQPGMRIRLLDMPSDPAPIAPGTEGVVTWIDEGTLPQIEVHWNDGRSLSLIPGVDKYEVIDWKSEAQRAMEHMILEEAASHLGYTKAELMDAIKQTGCEGEVDATLDIAFARGLASKAWLQASRPLAQEIASLVSEREFLNPPPVIFGRR